MLFITQAHEEKISRCFFDGNSNNNPRPALKISCKNQFQPERISTSNGGDFSSYLHTQFRGRLRNIAEPEDFIGYNLNCGGSIHFLLCQKGEGRGKKASWKRENPEKRDRAA